MGAIFRVYLSMILPSERKRMLAAMRLALEKVKVKISNLRDAQDAFERFIANNTDLVIKDVFGAKIRQLVEVESQEGGEKSEEHTSELQSPCNLVCRLLLEKKKNI